MLFALIFLRFMGVDLHKFSLSPPPELLYGLLLPSVLGGPQVGLLRAEEPRTLHRDAQEDLVLCQNNVMSSTNQAHTF